MKSEIKELVAEGKLDEALDELVAYLEKQIDDYSPLYRAAQVARSEFSQLRDKELQGLLSEEQIRLAKNFTANRILEISEKAERGPSPTPPVGSNKWLWFGIGATVITLAVVFVWWRSTNTAPQSPEPQKPRDSILVVKPLPFSCPTFAERTEYAIAVIDFTTRNNADDNADGILVETIDGIFLRHDYPGDVTLIKNVNQPVDVSFAKSLVNNCKTQMVIWGRILDEKQIELNFYAPSMNKQQRNELDTLLQIREQGSFQASIIQAALIIASRVLVLNNAPGAVAVAEEAYQKTVKVSTNTAKTEAIASNSKAMATMTLANAHANKKDYKKSVIYYNELLDKRHNDTVALNNLAVVQIKLNDAKGVEKSIDSLKRYQQITEPDLLDAAGEALLRKEGFTRKGAEFKKDAREAQAIQDKKLLQREIKILPKE